MEKVSEQTVCIISYSNVFSSTRLYCVSASHSSLYNCFSEPDVCVHLSVCVSVSCSSLCVYVCVCVCDCN